MMAFRDIAGLGGALLLAAAVLIVLVSVMPGPRRPPACWRRLMTDTQGTATIEFALLFPIALLIMLAMAQVTLLMGGLIFVNYSAQAAVRSAVVKIPADHSYWGEPPNVIATDPTSAKYAAIHRSAVFAVVPVSGRLGTGAVPAQAYREALEHYFLAHGRTPPRWTQTLAGDRLRYAHANTFVTLVRTSMTPGGQAEFSDLDEDQLHWFGPREAVTVRVEHRMALSVPYVRALFADGWHDPQTGTGAYSWISARSTLVNHGIPEVLPPAPGLPRRSPN
jgi:hypothetical protein